MKHRCMNCDLTIHGVHCHSSIVNSPLGFLCKECSNYEEDQIHEYGTNRIPELLQIQEICL
jgi:hypothetical protein